MRDNAEQQQPTATKLLNVATQTERKAPESSALYATTTALGERCWVSATRWLFGVLDGRRRHHHTIVVVTATAAAAATPTSTTTGAKVCFGSSTIYNTSSTVWRLVGCVSIHVWHGMRSWRVFRRRCCVNNWMSLISPGMFNALHKMNWCDHQIYRHTLRRISTHPNTRTHLAFQRRHHRTGNRNVSWFRMGTMYSRSAV